MSYSVSTFECLDPAETFTFGIQVYLRNIEINKHNHGPTITTITNGTTAHTPIVLYMYIGHYANYFFLNLHEHYKYKQYNAL